MCGITQTLRAYRDWALDNPSKCSPRHHAVYTELALESERRNRPTVLVNTKDFQEYLGLKEGRLILSTLDDLAEAGLILIKYRSHNQKKDHEIALLFFHQTPTNHPQSNSEAHTKQTQSNSKADAKQDQNSPDPRGRAEEEVNINLKNKKPPISPSGEGQPQENEAWRGVEEEVSEEKLAVEVFLKTYGKGGNYFEVKSMWDSYPRATQNEILSCLPKYLQTCEGERERWKLSPSIFLRERRWIGYGPSEKPDHPLKGVSKDGDYESLLKPEFQAEAKLKSHGTSQYYQDFVNKLRAAA